MAMIGPHEYNAHLIWDGNLGEGTSTYTSYSRRYRVLIDGKPELHGSADPAFRGEPDRLNPEDLFLTALSSCHMLSYLALCAKHGLRVEAYDDHATGTMLFEASGSGRFTEVVLHPQVTVAAGSDLALAERLHHKAHEICFIANSVSIPVRNEPAIRVSGAIHSAE